jgi:hypothetical protein
MFHVCDQSITPRECQTLSDGHALHVNGTLHTMHPNGRIVYASSHAPVAGIVDEQYHADYADPEGLAPDGSTRWGGGAR